jgi:hypothetical protein
MLKTFLAGVFSATRWLDGEKPPAEGHHQDVKPRYPALPSNHLAMAQSPDP